MEHSRLGPAGQAGPAAACAAAGGFSAGGPLPHRASPAWLRAAWQRAEVEGLVGHPSERVVRADPLPRVSCLQVAASAAAEAAAALAAWEQAEGQPPAGGYGYAPADQQQQQLEYEEEYFEEEEEEEEGFYDPYRPFKLLLAGGAPGGGPALLYFLAHAP